MTSEPRLLPMAERHLAGALAIERSGGEFSWSEANFRDSLMVGYSAWVLDDDGEVLAFVLMSLVVHEAQILNIGVHEAHRRRGFARRLLGNMIVVARSAGMEEMFLEVRRSNQPAINLYFGLGFTKVGERAGYYRNDVGTEDALVLSLKLQPVA